MLTIFSPSTGGAFDRLQRSVRAPCMISCWDLTLFEAFQSSTRSNKTFRSSAVQVSAAGINWAPLSDSSPSSALELEGVEPKSSALPSASEGDIVIKLVVESGQVACWQAPGFQYCIMPSLS